MKKIGKVLTAIGLGIALLSTALVAPTITAAPAAAGTTDNTIQIVQHNTDMGGYAEAVSTAIAWGGVDALALQEVCKSQVQQARAEGWAVVWAQQKADASGCTPGTGDFPRSKGVAIFASPERIHTDTVVKKQLLTSGNRTFWLICAQLKNTGVPNTWLCTSHFPLGDGDGTGSDPRLQVATKIRSILAPWVAEGRRVVLTGDFNAAPSTREIEPLYRVQGSGVDNDPFWEGDQMRSCESLCRNMQPTTDNDRKLDYFFTSWRGVNPQNGLSKTVVPSGTSGHHIIQGVVNFQPL